MAAIVATCRRGVDGSGALYPAVVTNRCFHHRAVCFYTQAVSMIVFACVGPRRRLDSLTSRPLLTFHSIPNFALCAGCVLGTYL